jgi:hypothetical protein
LHAFTLLPTFLGGRIRDKKKEIIEIGRLTKLEGSLLYVLLAIKSLKKNHLIPYIFLLEFSIIDL